MDGMYVQGANFMIKWLYLEDGSLLCYSNSLTIFLPYFFRSPSYGGSLILYSLFQTISIVHLFIIQPCTQVSVLLSVFSGFL